MSSGSDRERRLARYAPLALLLLAGVALRWQVSWEFHAPAGDGIGFHRLAHELRAHGRYAYGPGAPLDFTREPGWPIVIAAIDTGRGDDIEHVLVWATRLNALLDALTALFVLLMARDLGLGRRAWLACALTVFCPVLILHSCYLLRETLAATVLTASLWLAVRASVRRDWRWLIASSAVLGLALLVRFDLLPVGLALVVPWARLPGTRTKLRVATLSLVACGAVVAPWPIRNLVRFGEPHFAGGMWADASGVQMPLGERWWLRTWVNGIRLAGGGGPGWLNFRISYHQPIGERDVPVEAADSPGERREVLALFARYNREGISPAVDAGFRELAARRTREHPLRVLLWLPLRRAAIWYWSFPPPEELPLRSRTLHQPEWRGVFEVASHLFALLGALGVVVLVTAGLGEFARMAVLALVVRGLSMSLVAPDGGYQRYLIPVYPVLLVAAAAAIGAIAAAAARAWRSARIA